MSIAARRGTLLVIVLGMIAIFLSLLLAVTTRVVQVSRNGAVTSMQAQAFIMLQSARLLRRSLAYPSTPTSIADEIDTVPNRLMGDRLGWARVNGAHVLAVGGASAAGAQVKTAIDDGPSQLNAREQRWYYQLDGSTPPTASLQPMGSYAGW